ncbi:MAG TPA: transcription antitermination factor NusB [Thermoanaerobaculia bacterium]|jgi:N utilization substance protein B|nr:transcription antitermination factor NusB [Thermoanaerobaculia bacterium]
MTAGKRRTAREMAIQMLYQSDLGGSALPHIFNTFDLAEYVNSEMAAEGKRRSDAGGEDDAGERAAARARARKRAEDAFVYAQGLVRGVIENVDRVDEMIRGQADHWRLERMPAVDRNVLRLAVYEMLYEKETPKLVVLDEAIELAKKFGSEQSGRFVNGLLDGLLKQHTFPGSLT